MTTPNFGVYVVNWPMVVPQFTYLDDPDALVVSNKIYKKFNKDVIKVFCAILR